MSEPFVSLEFTPNPNTLKYVVEKVLISRGAANYTSSDQALGKSILATKLFVTPGVQAVMIGRNFVTITKADNGEWDQVHAPTEQIIKDFLMTDDKAVEEVSLVATSDSDDIESKIKKVLDDEIRPAVAQDGGDITFDKFENGTVYLFMQGSCAGCPSSTMTLKMGIETRLRELFPEVQHVEAI